MKYFLILSLVLISFSAHADELYSDTPKCAMIKNDTSVNEFVAIRTDFYTKPDGQRSYYEEILHLEPNKEREICVKGPFYPDYKVTLTVKSFLPLFECKTKLEGTIAVHDKPSETTEGARTVWADCVN